MIIVITQEEYNETIHRQQIIVSHGINYYTGEMVVLPHVSIDELGATYNNILGEYTLKD